MSSKEEFLLRLRNGLVGLTKDDVDERLTFYREMIEDRIEDGHSEQEAVSSVGSVDEIVSKTLAEITLGKIAKEGNKPKRRLSLWEFILLTLGSPIWLSICIAVLVAIFSIYVSLWSVIISLWAAFVSLLLCSIGGIVSGIVICCKDSALTGLAVVACGIFSTGFSIYFYYGCKMVTKGLVLLTKKVALGIKKCFIKKEEA